MTRNPDEGAGPFTRTAPALGAGEQWAINLARESHNGQDRWFTPYLPMDSLRIFNNDVANPVEVTINGRYPITVLPDTIEVFSQQGIRYFTIENTGSTTIAAGDVEVSFLKEPWGADKQAQEKRNSPFLARAMSDIVPGGLL